MVLFAFGLLFMTQTLFDLILTISVRAVVDRFRTLERMKLGTAMQHVILRQMIETLANFQDAFGGIMMLHLSWYTVHILETAFNILVQVRYGLYQVSLSFLPCLIGSWFKIYNIASGCDLLTKEIVQYVEYLNNCDVTLDKHSHERRVRLNMIEFSTSVNFALYYVYLH